MNQETNKRCMRVILSERVSTIAILHDFVSIGSVDTNMTDCHQQGRSVFGFGVTLSRARHIGMEYFWGWMF
jgi:hypothetical protein